MGIALGRRVLDRVNGVYATKFLGSIASGKAS